MNLARRLEARILVAVVVANLLGVLALVLTAVVAMRAPGDGTARAHVVVANLELGAVFLAAASAFGLTHVRRRFRPIAAWLRAERAATALERRVVMTQPWRQAAWVGLYWVLAAAVLAVFNARYYDSAQRIMEIAAAVLLFGVVASAVTYVVVEWTMRPALARALAAGADAGAVEEPPAASGVLTRLLMAWLFGSGVFFLYIFVVPFGRSGDDLAHLSGFFRLLAIGGFTAGLTVMVVVARDLAQRLLVLRRALDDVRHGDLDASVAVDDATEVGMLQSGFNEMVAGLRERKLVEDLFGRHVGPDVARHAIADGVHLGGEQREVSVVFVDVVGSTALAGTRPPDEVVALLNRFFSVVVAEVGAEGGWVNKFEGDAALCVFGAPEDQPDHAARALRAAAALQRALVRGASSLLDVGIGVSTGVAVAGNVGTEARFEYTVIGDPANEAARLSDEAKRHPCRVLASSRSVDAAGDGSAWRPAGELLLRGRVQPTDVYEPA